MTMVQENRRPSGQVLSIARYAYFLRGEEIVFEDLAVFPGERAWATKAIEVACHSSCKEALVENITFATPSWNRQLITTKEFSEVGARRTIDGQTAIRMAPVPSMPGAPTSAPLIYISPSTYEVIQESSGPGNVVVNYRYLPGTPANDAHLELAVPKGFREVSAQYAQAGNPPIPTSKGPVPSSAFG
jgi:hypothetical protein